MVKMYNIMKYVSDKTGGFSLLFLMIWKIFLPIASFCKANIFNLLSFPCILVPFCFVPLLLPFPFLHPPMLNFFFPVLFLFCFLFLSCFLQYFLSFLHLFLSVHYLSSIHFKLYITPKRALS